VTDLGALLPSEAGGEIGEFLRLLISMIDDYNGRSGKLIDDVLHESIGRAITDGFLVMLKVAGEGTESVTNTDDVKYTAHATTETSRLNLKFSAATGYQVRVHTGILIPPDDVGAETYTAGINQGSQSNTKRQLISTPNGTNQNFDTNGTAEKGETWICPGSVMSLTSSAVMQAGATVTLVSDVEIRPIGRTFV